MDVLLAPYLEGAREAGADVELYHSRDLVIFPCCGNLNCTIGTPGNCMAYDDMRWLRPKIGQADVLVLASPLYFDGNAGPGGMTASMRPIRERLVIGMGPSGERPYEHAVHTTREAIRLRKVVLVSGCGFWEVDGLNPVLTHVKAFCLNAYPGLEGSIPEPRGAILRGELGNASSREDIRLAAGEAGRRLVNEGEADIVGAFLPPSPKGAHRVKRNWEDLILYQF